MWKDVIDMITGGIIGVVVTAIFSYFNLKFSYKKLFAESVSKNRMDWMNIWRENLAILIGCAESLHYAKNHDSINYQAIAKSVNNNSNTPFGYRNANQHTYNNEFLFTYKVGLHDDFLYGDYNSPYIKYRNDFYKARNAIISRLNMQEEKHVLMYGALNNFDYTKSDEDFEKQKAYIIELARAILKPEWERFKDEARGKEK